MAQQLPEIQGKRPDSKEEVWIAQALYKYKIQFIFQYAVIPHIRRGFIVDFLLVQTNTPLEVYGNYWHENELPGGDIIRLNSIKEYFGVEPLVVWGNELKTAQDADSWVRRNVAR